MKWFALALALIACSVMSPGRALAGPSLERAAGYLPHAELVEAYVASVRIFNPKLSTTESERVAEIVLDESNATDLDARLLLAVLNVDGTLTGIHSSAKGLRVRKQAAREVIGNTAGAAAATPLVERSPSREIP